MARPRKRCVGAMCCDRRGAVAHPLLGLCNGSCRTRMLGMWRRTVTKAATPLRLMKKTTAPTVTSRRRTRAQTWLSTPTPPATAMVLSPRMTSQRQTVTSRLQPWAATAVTVPRCNTHRHSPAPASALARAISSTSNLSTSVVPPSASYVSAGVVVHAYSLFRARVRW